MRLRSLAGLALQNLSGSAFRSWLIALCALLIAAFVLATVLVVRGAQDSLTLANARLGADIIVVPQGAETSVNGALLMGTPTTYWMPDVDVDRIAALPGVAAASPQLYLQSLADAPCCSVPNMLMVAFDPATDFTLDRGSSSSSGATWPRARRSAAATCSCPRGWTISSYTRTLSTCAATWSPRAPTLTAPSS